MGNRQTLEDEIINLRMAAKQLHRQHLKCVKMEKAEKTKVKNAIRDGNMDIARIHAENAIRNKSQSLNFLRLSSRMDAICQRMQSAAAMKNLNTSMESVTKTMSNAIKAMDIEKISKTMDQFEKNFEDLDIQSGVMEDAIQQSTGTIMPESQVQNLMKEVAEENNLDIEANLNDIVVPSAQKQQQEEEVEEMDEKELQRRFNNL